MAGKRRTVVTPPPQFPYDIILEILKRLPAKSLMRFKCVSKEWFRIIEDPFFVESHQSHARTRPDASHILFACHLPRFRVHTIFSTNQDLAFSSQLPSHNFSYEIQDCSNIANGLVCASSHGSCLGEPSLWLLNLTTMQKKALPTPELICPSRYCSAYFLGFDPVSKKYKILHRHYCDDGCVILTLGSETWRPVTGLIPKKLGFEAIYMDGRIYFKKGDTIRGAIIFFDLNEEKFQLLSVPKDSVHREDPVGWFSYPDYYQEITEIRGKLALVRELKTWILEHNNWVEKNISLPNTICKEKFVGVTGNCKILLKCKDMSSNWEISNYYLYDLNTSECIATRSTLQPWSFGNMNVNLISSSCEPLFCNYIENIIPL